MVLVDGKMGKRTTGRPRTGKGRKGTGAGVGGAAGGVLLVGGFAQTSGRKRTRSRARKGGRWLRRSKDQMRAGGLGGRKCQGLSIGQYR